MGSDLLLEKVKNILKNSLLWDVGRACRLNKFRREWRNNNLYNETLPVNCFDPRLVVVGNFSYGELCVVSFNRNSWLRIGNLCSIAQGVKFVLDADHCTAFLATFPFKVKILKECQYEASSKGDIIVGDDVWIGYGATILSGVHIGQGAVVAAGAVVTKNIPPYAIAGGVPARVIKYRFSPEIREKLLTIDYGRMDAAFIKANRDLLIKKIDEEFFTDEEWERLRPVRRQS